MIIVLCHRNDRPRGFTLVELLVVITLMGILTGMMTIALSSARQDARIRRTRVEVQTITVILQQKVNDISLAPVSYVGTFPASTGGVGAVSAVQRNRATMLARRDLMRMKLPQCRADLIYPPARIQFLRGTVASATKVEQPSEWAQMRRIAGFAFPSGIQVENASVRPVFTLPAVDSAGEYFGSGPPQALLRTRLGQIRVPSNPTTFDVIDLKDVVSTPWPELGSPRAGEVWTRDFESAECLYLILATTEIFGQRALDQFSARSIANLDGDAVPEIVDPWGNPYEFIREPVGRIFRVQSTTVLPSDSHPDAPDPSDYLRTDFRFTNNDTSTPITMVDDPYRVSPLVVSAGQDGEFGFRRSFDRQGDFTTDRMGVSPRYSTSNKRLTTPPGPTLPGLYQYPDPYAQLRASNTAPYLSGANNPNIRFVDLSAATLFSWHGSATLPAVGLGAAFLTSGNELDESYADNVASDDPE